MLDNLRRTVRTSSPNALRNGPLTRHSQQPGPTQPSGGECRVPPSRTGPPTQQPGCNYRNTTTITVNTYTSSLKTRPMARMGRLVSIAKPDRRHSRITAPIGMVCDYDRAATTLPAKTMSCLRQAAASGQRTTWTVANKPNSWRSSHSW